MLVCTHVLYFTSSEREPVFLVVCVCYLSFHAIEQNQSLLIPTQNVPLMYEKHTEARKGFHLPNPP